MRNFSILALVILMLLALSLIANAGGDVRVENPYDVKNEQKGTGTYFEVILTAQDGSPVVWKNWRDGSKYRGEALIDGNKSIVIVNNGFTHILSPDVKVAKKSKIETSAIKNPMARKWAKLADLPQIEPEKYLSFIQAHNAQKQGPVEAKKNEKATLYTLKVPEAENFPWNDFMIWIDTEKLVPTKVTYMDNGAKRELNFKNVRTKIKVDPLIFLVPADYKVIFFEW